MAWIVAAITTLVVALFVVELQIAAPPYVEKSSDHFDGKKFVNPNDGDTHHYWEVLKWWFSGYDRGEWHKLEENQIAQYPAPARSVPEGSFSTTFINHATYLLQLDGLNILTDPVWSFRASPYQWIGPKRMRPPGIAFNDLPDIDVVLLTHNHYDHLDLPTVKKLHQKYDPKFVVPLGVEKLLHDHGISKTTHLDWWNHHSITDSLSLTAVPAQHFSGRGLFDRNKTLWCGYVIHASIGNIYFAGDTGYGDFIGAIGNKFGPIHTSFLPIGAYKPRWFMQKIHMSPKEAVRAHKHVQSQQSFAMHYGTFPMADDGMYEPVENLLHSLNELNVNEQEFKVLEAGESKLFNALDSADVA